MYKPKTSQEATEVGRRSQSQRENKENAGSTRSRLDSVRPIVSLGFRQLHQLDSIAATTGLAVPVI